MVLVCRLANYKNYSDGLEAKFIIHIIIYYIYIKSIAFWARIAPMCRVRIAMHCDIRSEFKPVSHSWPPAKRGPLHISSSYVQSQEARYYDIRLEPKPVSYSWFPFQVGTLHILP